MYKKIRPVLINGLLILMIVCLTCGGLTFGRYSTGERNAETNWQDGIGFSLQDKLTVNSAQDLLSAIQSGYSNIVIGDDVANPLIVLSGAEDVTANVLIDLNGHDIIRASHDYLLRVNEGITLAVTDSSENQTGRLYNPVGSSLEVNGGSVVFNAGGAESGPRDYYYEDTSTGEYSRGSEYYSDRKQSGTADADYETYVGGTLSGTVQSVEYYAKSNSGENYEYTKESEKQMPIITPYTAEDSVGVEVDGKNYYVNGGVYLDGEYEVEGTTVFPADTYLYYSEENATLAATADSADFYYSYYVTRTVSDGNLSYSYASEKTNDAIKVTVYGFYDVVYMAAYGDYRNPSEPGTAGRGTGADYNDKRYYKSTAFEINTSDAENLAYTDDSESDAKNYAALVMNSGSIKILGGQFVSYFGIQPTGSVYASGGNIEIESGAFSAEREGRCIRAAESGGSDAFEVSGGSFYCEWGSAIRVASGSLTVTGGAFEKHTEGSVKNCNNPNYSDADVYGDATGGILKGQNRALIRVAENAVITVNGTASAPVTFSATGSGINGIRAASGATVEVYNAAFNFGSENTKDSGYINDVGIFCAGGNVTVDYTSFSMNGEKSIGVWALNGSVTLGTSTGRSDYGVTLTAAHVVNCFGIVLGQGSNTSGGTVTVNSASFDMGASGYASGSDSVPMQSAAADYTREKDGQNAEVLTPIADGLFNSAGIFLNTSNSSAAININDLKVMMHASYSAGVYAKGGSLTFMGESDITVSDGVAVDLEGGSLNVDNNAEVNITAALKTENTNTADDGTSFARCDGIYLSGGSFKTSGSLKIIFAGFNNADQTQKGSASYYAPLKNETKSYAVRVSGGLFEATGTLNVTSSVGGGVCVESGNVQLTGSETEGGYSISVSTTGTTLYSTRVLGTGVDRPIWDYYVSKTGGTGLRVSGGSVSLKDTNISAALGNAVWVSGGNLTVNGGSYDGSSGFASVLSAMSGESDYDKTLSTSGLGSYYGIALTGSGELTVNGGDFLGYGGGALMHCEESGETCTGYIVSGTFVGEGNNGFLIGYGVTAVFGGFGNDDDDLIVQGGECGLDIDKDNLLTGDAAKTYVEVRSGNYANETDGNGTTTYLDHGSIFRGNSTSGNLKLYGGKFSGRGGSKGGLIYGGTNCTVAEYLGFLCTLYTINGNVVSSTKTTTDLKGSEDDDHYYYVKQYTSGWIPTASEDGSYSYDGVSFTRADGGTDECVFSIYCESACRYTFNYSVTGDMTVSYTKYGETTETASETLNGKYTGARLTCAAETYITFTCSSSASAASITNISCLNCSETGKRDVGESTTYLDTTDSTVSKDIDDDGEDESIVYRSDGVLYYAMVNGEKFDQTNNTDYYLMLDNNNVSGIVTYYIYSTCGVEISKLNIYSYLDDSSKGIDDLNYTVTIYRASTGTTENLDLIIKSGTNSNQTEETNITLGEGDYIKIQGRSAVRINPKIGSYTYTIGTDTSSDTFGTKIGG